MRVGATLSVSPTVVLGASAVILGGTGDMAAGATCDGLAAAGWAPADGGSSRMPMIVMSSERNSRASHVWYERATTYTPKSTTATQRRNRSHHRSPLSAAAWLSRRSRAAVL